MPSSKKTLKKITKLENIFLTILVIIACKLFFIAIIHHDYWLEKARVPYRKKRIVKASRGMIEDALGIPLATNTGQYLVGIQYSELKAIPRMKKKFFQKSYPRKEKIEELAAFLAKHLDLEKQWILDEINAKALFDPHNVYTLKENIDERLFYFLKMHEGNFPGLVVQKEFKRLYPNPFNACHLIGYLGRINQQEHSKIQAELTFLKQFINQKNLGLDLQIPKEYANFEQMQKKLHHLEQKVYRPDDFIGKDGLEQRYQHYLRGFHGIQLFEADPIGKTICSFSSSTMPIQGQTIRLHLLSPLQEYCQKLLAHPIIQQTNHSSFIEKGKKKSLIEPWMKPGSILVMDPKNGAILAMASYPFYSPQDFIDGNSEKIHQWLETPAYQARLFMQQAALERPLNIDGNVVIEKKYLTWKAFLEHILPEDHLVLIALQKILTLQKATAFMVNLEQLAMEQGCSMQSYIESHPLPSPFQHLNCYDRLLLIDLLRLNFDYRQITKSLLGCIKEISLFNYHEQECDFFRLKLEMSNHLKKAFEKIDFKQWRENNEATFFKKLPKKMSKPFTYYLDQIQKEQFEQFIQTNFYRCIEALFYSNSISTLEPYLNFLQEISLPKSLKKIAAQIPVEDFIQYLQTFTHVEEKTEELFGNYALIGKNKTLKDLAMSFYPKFGFGFMRNHALTAQTPGSIFKLNIALLALEHNEHHFSITDISLNHKIATLPTGENLSRFYKGGRLPKSYSPYLGFMDFHEAIKVSSNPYFSLLAEKIKQTGVDLTKNAKDLGFGAKTGVDLPYEQQGFVPWDIEMNPSYLFAYAIGQHSLKTTPLQIANLFANIANVGKIYQPQVVKILFGHKRSMSLTPLFNSVSYPHGDHLELVGIYFPLFCKLAKHSTRNTKKTVPSLIKETPMEKEKITLLKKAMKDVIAKPKGTAYIRSTKAPFYSELQQIKSRMIGKTSTAQVISTFSLDQNQTQKTYKVHWFGSIFYEEENLQTPKLVIVINAPYGPPSKVLAAMSASIALEYEKITGN